MTTEWEDRYKRQEEKAEQGFVRCDDLDCPAREDPDLDSIEELREAYRHWSSHGYLSGCSHAC